MLFLRSLRRAKGNSSGSAGSSLWQSAAIDFVVVVLGILVALAIDEWRQDRADREEELHTLVQLQVDFEATVRELEGRVGQERRLVEAGRRLVNYSHDFRLEAPGDTLSEWWVAANNDPPILIAGGTVGSLVSSGRLSLLRTDSLRSQLAQTIGSLEMELALIRTLSMNSFEMFGDPYFSSELGLFQMYSTGQRGVRGLAETTAFSLDWSEARKDRRFGSLMTRVWLLKRNRLLSLERMRDGAARMLATIEAELNSR